MHEPLLADAAAPGDPPQTLLLYISRSRLDVFGGLFGGLKRPIVRSRVRSGAAEMLRDLRERLERQFHQR